jgi:phosphoribosylformylglycinamidine synthase subunit PurSL
VLFSTIGRMDDIGRAVTMFFKNPGDSIYVVGLTANELGGSEYFRLLAREQGTPASYGGNLPKLDISRALATYGAMHAAICNQLLRSSHTPTVGGLAVGFALPIVGGDLGAEIHLASLACDGELDDDAKLFAESNSRFVISCAPENETALEALFHGLPCARVGKVTAEKRLFILGEGGRKIVDADIDALRCAFKETLYGV